MTQEDRFDAVSGPGHALLFREHPDAIIVADSDGIIVEANLAAESLVGRPRADLIGLHHTVLHPPRDHAEHASTFRERFENGGVAETACVLLNADGREIPVVVSGTVIDDRGRKFALGVFRVMSDRLAERQELLEARDALLESATRHQAMLDAVPDLLFHLDREGRFLDFRAPRNLLHHQDCLHGKLNRDVSPPEFARLIEEKIALTLNSAEMQLFEYDLEVSGRSRKFEARMVPCGNSSVIAFVRDITEQRMIETEFLESEKSRLVGQIAGGIAHDFNNILAATMGAAEILEDAFEVGSRDRELIRVILNASERGAKLTGKLLAFAMKGKVGKRTFSLGEVLGDLSGILESGGEGRIDFTIDDMTCNSLVYGDPIQVQQAILEVAFNGMDSMPAGGRISISATVWNLDSQSGMSALAKLSPGPYLRVEVVDSGMGIPQEMVGHVFEPFFTTKLQLGRTGMGLSAALGIIRNHGGEILIESTVGQGTMAIILLPVHESGSVSETMDETAQAAGATILLADDEEHVRETMAIILETAGYRVIKCCDGVEAVETFASRKSEIDLVIVDYVMPGKSGVTAIREIIQIDPEARVLIASGFLPDGELKAIIDAGIADFIKKPCQKSHFYSIVKKALGED